MRRNDVEGDPGAFWLRIVGKGGHERTVPISDKLAAVLMESPEVHVSPARDRWGKVVEGHVSAQHLGKLTAAALPDDWTLHRVRHRYATLA
jgi:integrase/recombinase XerD